jgi:hypothetical protein
MAGEDVRVRATESSSGAACGMGTACTSSFSTPHKTLARIVAAVRVLETVFSQVSIEVLKLLS